MKRQKFDDGPLLHVMAPAIDLTGVPDVSSETIPGVKSGYWRYRDIFFDNARQPANAPVDMKDEFDDIFEQQRLW